jgi:A/G-specific adenine glycosylase
MTPWHVVVSEFMLQQTQVDRVIPKYEAFFRKWPTVGDFARARLGSVLAAWSGLGYNRRARNLWHAAQAIMRDHGGTVPHDREALRRLPGIGPYTVEAIRAFAFNTDAVVVDTNIRRIFARLRYGGEYSRRAYTEEDIERLIAAALPKGRSRDWYGALMDFGSLVCTARTPSCVACPLRKSCVAAPFMIAGVAPKRALRRPQAKFEGSPRQKRGAVLKALVAAGRKGMTLRAIAKESGLPGIPDAVRELVKEGLVRARGGVVQLP